MKLTKNGNTDLVQQEVITCTRLALENGKIAKWIIEIAALSNDQIADITKKDCYMDRRKIFLKMQIKFL